MTIENAAYALPKRSSETHPAKRPSFFRRPHTKKTTTNYKENHHVRPTHPRSELRQFIAQRCRYRPQKRQRRPKLPRRTFGYARSRYHLQQRRQQTPSSPDRSQLPRRRSGYAVERTGKTRPARPHQSRRTPHRPRRRKISRVRPHRPRRPRRTESLHPARPATQPRQHQRHPRRAGTFPRPAQRRRDGHLVPPNHARTRLHLRRAARIA